MQIERGGHQKPQTHQNEQPLEKTGMGARQDRDSNPGGQSRVAEYKVIPTPVFLMHLPLDQSNIKH
jgi:hypothetical protein